MFEHLSKLLARGTFIVELWHLVDFALLGHAAPSSGAVAGRDTETIVMLTVLGLIDVVMIATCSSW